MYDCSVYSVSVFRKTTVLGFTRETVYALTTGIESVEWKRRQGVLENPRSGTTDDVECMFSIMRDLTGKHFTLREARYTWRKVCIEFTKRLDPDLGFYYFTSSHDRFIEGERPDFDQKSTRKSSNIRPRRRERPSNLMYGLATFPQAAAQSLRVKYHNLPVDVPPPPGTSSHLSDHAYV